jgi:F-type H+-transporting ATPase subunit delta
MLGSSRSSFAAARKTLVQRAGSDGTPDLADDLLAVSTLLAGSPRLRGILADSGTDAMARTALARSVFDGKVGAATLDVVGDVAGRRWTSGADLVDAFEELGFEAAFIAAEQAGRLDAVEDELFRVDRLVAGDDGLREALSDRSVPDDAKAALLGGLLDGKVGELTARLVRHVVAHPRGRRLAEALDSLVHQSARRRERLLAKVRVAQELTDEQSERLTAALGRVYRHDVDLQVEVDPQVGGGVVVQVGDEVIDGSIANRIEQVRRTLGV